jgi:6-phosphofructokinase
VCDEPHRHRYIDAVLGKEASHIALMIALDTSLEADVRRGDEIQEPENEEDNESTENKLLTFHCVFP